MDKVNSEIKKKLMEIILEEFDDPHLSSVSITHVVTSKDLRECKVYYSSFRDEDLPRIGTSLDKLSGFIRKLLGDKLRIRILPSLVFLPDTSIKYSVEINRKIEEVLGDKEDTSDDQRE